MSAKCRQEKERRFILFRERGTSDPTLADIVLLQYTIYEFNLDCSIASGSQSQTLRYLLRPCSLSLIEAKQGLLDFLGERQQIKQLQRPKQQITFWSCGLLLNDNRALLDSCNSLESPRKFLGFSAIDRESYLGASAWG